jgi:signal transduction histidine kinase/CheY-like chemotaxis protein/HPt (histidine-containing phosphotransfer) domain-containing protein
MNKGRRQPDAFVNPSIMGLTGIAITCLLLVLGLNLLFDRLQEDLREKSSNERARLFVGEEIVRGIHEIEKSMYKMAATNNAAALTRVHREIDAQLDKLTHDLDVLKNGGTVRRQMLLNIEGRDEIVREASYRTDSENQGYVMELIEIAPLLDRLRDKPRELEPMLIQRQDCLETEDRNCLVRVLPEISAFLKQLPPYFERLDENANRLFLDSSERLRELEGRLKQQRESLKRVEIGLIALVMLLAGLAGMLFVRRINQANRELEMALAAMRDAKDTAEHASQAKSEFVSRMSHELRTPLNAILGFAELLEAETLSPAHKNYVAIINSSGQHLMALINAVLDHAKIEAGGLTLEEIAFDFSATIAAVNTIVAERAAGKGLEFVTHIDAALPRHVVGDPTRLRQILINLLVNAVKFTQRGSVELRVMAEVGRIAFSVRDTGIGMDEAALARLFKPFSQADDSVTRKFGGTGLGLMISRELIEGMGGRIEVESTPEVGTVFRFWLPLPAAPEAAAPAIGVAIAAGQAAIAQPAAGPVLVVDDNRVNQQLAGAMLKRLGFAHECADNGVDALRRLASADFSLVLMDMEMPEMDGVTATRCIRAGEADRGDGHSSRQLPIIAMTANALREDRERCLAAGMNGFISKPISLNSLQNELSRVLPGSAATPAEIAPAPPAVTSGDVVFDRAAALAMIDDDEDLFQQLAEIFVAGAPGYLQEIDQALAVGDSARLIRAVHTLKGLFGTFAATTGQALAAQLEKILRNGEMASCGELVAAVRAQTEALAATIKA